MQISPMVLEFLLLTNMTRIMPAIKAMGASLSVLNSHRNKLSSDWIEPSRMICAVTVVPMFAPMTMDTA